MLAFACLFLALPSISILALFSFGLLAFPGLFIKKLRLPLDGLCFLVSPPVANLRFAAACRLVEAPLLGCQSFCAFFILFLLLVHLRCNRLLRIEDSHHLRCTSNKKATTSLYNLWMKHALNGCHLVHLRVVFLLADRVAAAFSKKRQRRQPANRRLTKNKAKHRLD